MKTKKKSVFMLVFGVVGVLLLAASCGKEEVAEPADPVYPMPGVVTHTVEITGPTGKKATMEMVLVRSGVFKMGAGADDSEASSWEKPMHPVVITNDFYISVTEVTQEQYEVLTGGKNPSVYARGGSYPVDNVSYDEAEAFCTTLSMRSGNTFLLPTEAQWEYAARGGHVAPSEATRYSGSNVLDRVAWYAENSGSEPHEVGQKAPNALGLRDMSGNVWEWCSDWYGADYFTEDTVVNPQGAAMSDVRVIRGGGWNGVASSCRVTDRDYYDPQGRSQSVGFRVVMKIAE